jgi:hypothetical protein
MGEGDICGAGAGAAKFPNFSRTFVRPCPHVVDDKAI